MNSHISASRSSLLLLVFVLSCDVNGTGLDPYGIGDGGQDGKVGMLCPAGLIENANWSTAIKEPSCTEPCGPDKLGAKLCHPVDLKTCQGTKECVCGTPPCTACNACAIPSIPICLQPINANKPGTCASGVSKGGACAPACGRMLCMLANGKTGCICNSSGVWICASWSQGAWH